MDILTKNQNTTIIFTIKIECINSKWKTKREELKKNIAEVVRTQTTLLLNNDDIGTIGCPSALMIEITSLRLEYNSLVIKEEEERATAMTVYFEEMSRNMASIKPIMPIHDGLKEICRPPTLEEIAGRRYGILYAMELSVHPIVARRRIKKKGTVEVTDGVPVIVFFTPGNGDEIVEISYHNINNTSGTIDCVYDKKEMIWKSQDCPSCFNLSLNQPIGSILLTINGKIINVTNEETALSCWLSLADCNIPIL